MFFCTAGRCRGCCGRAMESTTGAASGTWASACLLAGCVEIGLVPGVDPAFGPLGLFTCVGCGTITCLLAGVLRSWLYLRRRRLIPAFGGDDLLNTKNVRSGDLRRTPT